MLQNCYAEYRIRPKLLNDLRFYRMATQSIIGATDIAHPEETGSVLGAMLLAEFDCITGIIPCTATSPNGKRPA